MLILSTPCSFIIASFAGVTVSGLPISTVYSLSEQYTIRPDGTAEILFNGAELIGELQVCISGCYIKATPCGDHYSAVYSPEPDETEAEAFVIGEQGYIGNFNVTFTAPISDNAAFDI